MTDQQFAQIMKVLKEILRETKLANVIQAKVWAEDEKTEEEK